MSESALRAAVADYAARLHARGWVANHDGNVTARLAEGRFIATPTALSKAAVRADALLVVDDAGARLSGPGRPFSEIGLHLTIYRARPDVQAVVHAHPPTATGFAVAGVALPEAMLAEAVVSLGPRVPTVPFAAPGPSACQALQPFVAEHDAVLLGGHGVLTWGVDVEQAYLRLELVEQLARVALVATQLGGARRLPDAVLPALLEARAKAGLGPRGRGAAAQSAAPVAASPAAPSERRTVFACAPAPPGADVEIYDPKRSRGATPPAPADLAALIRQEIAAALKG
jgi:L-fuculose-phosphate aldolase